MPSAKKKTATKKTQVTEAQVARLFVNLLDVYKTSCKNDVVRGELSTDQKRSVSKTLDVQMDIIKSRCYDQIGLLFKG